MKAHPISRFLAPQPFLLCISIAALMLGPLGKARAQTAIGFDVNGDSVVELENVFSGSPMFGGVSGWVNAVKAVHPENSIVPMTVGSSVDATTTWSPGNTAYAAGYYGIRFWSAAGIHYGWVETHNPQAGFTPLFVSGSTIKRSFYNPEPNQPIEVGDARLILRARLDPASGKLAIRWNTDASTFSGGVRLQSRTLQPGALWTTIQTIGTGIEATVTPTSEPRVYRVIY